MQKCDDSNVIRTKNGRQKEETRKKAIAVLAVKVTAANKYLCTTRELDGFMEEREAQWWCRCHDGAPHTKQNQKKMKRVVVICRNAEWEKVANSVAARSKHTTIV